MHRLKYQPSINKRKISRQYSTKLLVKNNLEKNKKESTKILNYVGTEAAGSTGIQCDAVENHSCHSTKRSENIVGQHEDKEVTLASVHQQLSVTPNESYDASYSNETLDISIRVYLADKWDSECLKPQTENYENNSGQELPVILDDENENQIVRLSDLKAQIATFMADNLNMFIELLKSKHDTGMSETDWDDTKNEFKDLQVNQQTEISDTIDKFFEDAIKLKDIARLKKKTQEMASKLKNLTLEEQESNARVQELSSELRQMKVEQRLIMACTNDGVNWNAFPYYQDLRSNECSNCKDLELTIDKLTQNNENLTEEIEEKGRAILNYLDEITFLKDQDKYNSAYIEDLIEQRQRNKRTIYWMNNELREKIVEIEQIVSVLRSKRMLIRCQEGMIKVLQQMNERSHVSRLKQMEMIGNIKEELDTLKQVV